MNTLPKYYRYILFSLLAIVSIQLDAQVNSVNKYLADVDQKVEQINYLANNKQVYQAITLLNETRRDLDRYVNYYLEDEMRKAKAEDPSFDPFINVRFSSILTAAYWEERVLKAQKSIDLAKEAMADSHHNRTLDTQDEAWSYLKTVYGIGKTIKDVADNVSKAQFFDAVKSAQEGVDGFIEDYKEIENARLQIINTQLYETTINGLIRRGEIMEEKAWQFSSFMRTYEQDVNDFYQIVGRLNQKIDQIKREEIINWNSTDYSWNKQTYLNQINAVAQQFKQGNFDYSTSKEKIETINEQAENDKIGIYQNIQNSGANDAFERGNQLEEEFNEFYDLSIDVLDECYRFDQNKEIKGVTTNSNETKSQSDNAQKSELEQLYAGAANVGAGASAKVYSAPNTSQANKLFHNRWERIGDGSQKISFRQNGNSVEIEGKGKGIIQNGVLVHTYTNSQGEKLTDKYILLGNGLEMEVELEVSRKLISNTIKLSSDFGSPERLNGPSEAQIDKYIKEKGKIRKFQYRIWSWAFSQTDNDTDGDGVSNDFDICPNTPAGFTVDNGGVDIAGCPTSGKSVSPNTSKTNISTSETTSNAFAGASNSTNQSNTTNQKTSPQTNTVPETNPISSPGLVGTITNDGNGKGTYCSLDLKTVKNTDIIVLKKLSGNLDRVEVIWRTSSGSWRTQYEGTRTNFKVSEFLNNIPNNITHFNFTVNAHHNRRYTANACIMEVWHLPAGGKIPPRQQVANSDSGSDKLTSDFNEFIRKADEAFNKKYWTESGGARATSNPKQESFDYLRKAQALIAQQQDVTQRYSMVLTLATKYAEYAKRVFANAAKNDFIQTAGSLLGQYGGAATSVKDAKAKAYNNIADGWRELTKAAMWGGHQYNKAACDIEAKKYYDLALREDRNNVQLQKTVEKINAPKKAVPAAVAATKPIPESSWAKAENLRNMIVENIPIQYDDGPHYSEIGQMKIDMGSINVGSGKVWLLRSGAKDWELVSKSGEYIFVGDKIKTSDDAKNISFDYSEDKTHLVIKSGSVVTFYLNQIYIERGDTEMYVKKRGKEFLVITPKAVTGCRGTEFSVKVDNSGTTDVHLFEGIVEMRNSTEISYLVPGQTAKVEKDDEAINVKQFNIQQHKQQFLSNQNQLNTTNQSNPGNQLQIFTETYQMSDATVGTKIGNTLQKGWTPVGLQTRSEPFDILYLNQDPFVITEWAIDWYSAADGNAVSNGITSKMQNEGFFPMGLSSANNRLYVLYAKGNMKGTAWQLIESSQNLQQVSQDIDPYIRQGYIPVGISTYSQWYYTLLVKVENSTFKSWAIQGYNSKQQMETDLSNRLNTQQIPFGYLEEKGIYNVLYVGF